MTNTQAIKKLEKLIAELDKRIDELRVWEQDPGGAIWEVMDRLDEILVQQTNLVTWRHHSRKRLRARELKRDLNEAVPKLTKARTKAFNKALGDVSNSIRHDQTFRAAMNAAVKVGMAAAKANSTVALSPGTPG